MPNLKVLKMKGQLNAAKSQISDEVCIIWYDLIVTELEAH
jgi:hypothetical protein